MTWRSRFACILALVALPVLSSSTVAANESNGTPAAKAFFAQGDALAKAGKPAEAAAAFRKAIDADPDYVDAHQRFIESTQRAEMPGSRTPSAPRLTELYTRWAARQPKRAAYQWALGFLATDPDKADAFFRAALGIDPSFARAHFLLARNADLRGDWESQRTHLKAAVDNNPDEPRYLLKYAQSFKRSDQARFRELASSVIQSFPDSQSAAEAMFHLASASSNPERRALFEQIRAKYPADKFGYGATAMYDLYDELTEPSEALSVAQEMAKAFPSGNTWARRVALQQALTEASVLIAQRKFTAALALLNKTERPSGSHAITWALLQADAAANNGQLEQAYTSLVESMAKLPDDRVDAALRKHGAALNKSPRDVEADIWHARDANAEPATPFQLPADRGAESMQLSDYRGRVVLVAFWFPG